MLHHLLTPPLLRYAGKQIDALPAPAACTQLGLRYMKFRENGPHGGDPVYLSDGAGERDET
jgi:hypothetical protein